MLPQNPVLTLLEFDSAMDTTSQRHRGRLTVQGVVGITKGGTEVDTSPTGGKGSGLVVISVVTDSVEDAVVSSVPRCGVVVVAATTTATVVSPGRVAVVTSVWRGRG